MTAVAQDIIDGFDRLSSPEQLAIAVEILRRVVELDFPPMTDEDLVLSAENLFLMLDRQESKLGFI